MRKLFLLPFLLLLVPETMLSADKILSTKKGKNVQAKNIPLSSIYSTSYQKGLKRVDQGIGDEGFSVEMRELSQTSLKMGASNIFLVRGKDIASAVEATLRVFAGGSSVDEPILADQGRPSGALWLVAYLGVAGSDPPAWLIRSAEVEKNVVRLRIKKSSSETDDEHPYFAWVPLGAPESATFTLELIEDNEQVQLSRRVKYSTK